MNRKTQLALATATVSGALLFLQVNADADTYTLQSGDSFYSVSQLYGMDVYDLAALDGMSIYDTIVPGQTLQVPDQVSVETTSTEEVATETTTNSDNTYPVGQYTWGVKELATWASNWGGMLVIGLLMRYTVGTQAEIGAIICWTDPDSYGHVAYVTAVSASGEIQVLESNYGDKQWIDNYRGWFDPTNSQTAGTVSYIYPTTY
ncbi:CHAP domain-containing protein [Streptococcus gallolyticus]